MVRTATQNRNVAYNMYETLFTIDAKGEILPLLIRKFTQIHDHLGPAGRSS